MECLRGEENGVLTDRGWSAAGKALARWTGNRQTLRRLVELGIPGT